MQTRNPAKKITGALFYLLLIAVIVAAFNLGGGGRLREIGGYSIARVLTASMQPVYPQGSVVLIKRVDTAGMQVGDDATYLTADGKIVTHRIKEIYENHLNSGHRGFVTKGVNNFSADPEIVYDTNIIGKVVWHSDAVGAALDWIRVNWTAAIVIALLLPLGILLVFLLRQFFKRAEGKQGKNPEV